MSPKPEKRLIPSSDSDDPRIVADEGDPVAGHDEWFRGEVQCALDHRAEHGDKDYKPWRKVFAKFGF